MTIRWNSAAGLLAVALAGLVGGGRPSAAIGPETLVTVAQLSYDGLWDPRPSAADVLAGELRARTSMDVRLRRDVKAVMDPGLFGRPLLFLVGDGRFRFQAEERVRLRKWIEAGGFLVVDNAARGQPSTAFDASLRAELEAMFPGRALQKIPPQHVLYRTFYVLDFPAGRAIHRTFLEGLFLDDRIAVVYSQNDLFGALDRDASGAYSFDVVPGGETQRERAIRLAVNLVQYAIGLDYKDDQVHTDYLIHQRRWRAGPPKVETP